VKSKVHCSILLNLVASDVGLNYSGCNSCGVLVASPRESVRVWGKVPSLESAGVIAEHSVSTRQLSSHHHETSDTFVSHDHFVVTIFHPELLQHTRVPPTSVYIAIEPLAS
jgi:hypothetical protein